MIRHIIRHLLWVLLQLIGLSAFSQVGGFRFARIGTEEGLSQSNVTCILRDSRGFMWFGTRNGLNRYDGYKVIVYMNNAANPSSLANNFIKCLFEDAGGSIWIGTWGGGLDRFDPDKGQFFHYKHDPKDPNSLSDDFVDCIAADHEGILWIGTYQGGLNKMDCRTHRCSRFISDRHDPGSISDDYVTSVMEDSHHRIWAGTYDGGLNLFDRKTSRFSHFEHDARIPASLSYNTITALTEDSAGRIWVATRGRGLDLLDTVTGSFRHFTNDPHHSNSLARDVVLSLAPDGNGNLWIGTENGGLSIYHPSSGVFTNYIHDDIDNTSLSNNSIYSIYRDPQGNMWVGTYSGGVNLFNPDANLFTLYRHTTDPASLGNNNILEFCEAGDGRIWIGTDGGGANLFDPQTGKFTHFMHQPGNPQSLCGNYVICVREDRDRNIWFGTCGDGITVYNPSTNTYRQVKNDPRNSGSLSNDNVPDIAVDQDGDLWVATWGGGLNRYDYAKRRFQRFIHSADPRSISSDRINNVFADSRGYLWIGTQENGLNRLDKRTGLFTHFVHDDHKNSLSHNMINCIFEDSRGLIWIGTGGGLDCLDSKTGRFTNYFAHDGLQGDIVFGVLEDGKGNLWISTDAGLSEFCPGTGIFTNFSAADGLQSGEFKGHAALRSRSGALYFGGNHGFNVFFPGSISKRAFDPPLVMTGFGIFNQEVPVATPGIASPLTSTITATHSITLSYKSTVLSFEFASLNYTIPEKKRYRYMLAGFDPGWNDIGTRRMATYTNLDAGKYVLMVEGLNNNGKWSGRSKSISITITPPFWRTWWFRIGAILCIAGGVIVFHRLRMGILKVQKKKLELQVAVLLDKAVAQGKFEIASDVLHDIGNAVVGFGSYLTRIRRLQDQDSPENMKRLAAYVTANRPALEASLGEVKAGAMITMLGSLAQSQHNSREEITRSVTELLGIIAQIQGILDIQRQYITGQETTERKPVKLKDIVSDSMAMLAGTADRHSICVSMDVANNLPLIKGDRTRLMQVVLNLLKNGMDSVVESGAGKNLSIKAGVEEGWLILRIQDSGSGYTEVVRDRLFERGFTTKPSGAGTGLYNSRVIMESHGGMVDLTSEGAGTGAVAKIAFRL